MLSSDILIQHASRVTSGPARAYRQVRRLHLEAGHMRKLMRSGVFLEECFANIRQSVLTRENVFLETVEVAIFRQPHSPYRPLLEAAGHEFASVKTLVGRLGVEGALRRLSADGVYVTIDEFKGNREAHRGNRTFSFIPADFDNPLVRSGLKAASGGTRSGRIPTTISVEDHRTGIEHLAAALDAYGVSSRPAAVWVGNGHGASLWAVAALTALRTPSIEWFTLLRERWTFYTFLTGLSRVYGVTLPRLTYAPFNNAARVLAWVKSVGATDGCVILTFPSLALRLALEAKSQSASLEKVTFITIGEPLTSAKLWAIQAVGGRAFSSLGFTEFGRATYGCANPAVPDDTHICRDGIAVIQRRRVVDRLGTEVDALLFTSLRPSARKILLNMETGDYSAIVRRQCGCPLESLGWTDHLQGIRSFEKLNAVGRMFLGSALYSLVEEELPVRFGGQPSDYQLLEEEDLEGFTRLTLLVHPRQNDIDERAILQSVEEALQRLSLAQSAVWRDAGIIRIRRAAPMLTATGKLMPLHHLGMTRNPES